MAAKMDVVLPCFNPEKTWVSKVLAADAYLQQQRPDWEVRFILVNDGEVDLVKGEDIGQLAKRLRSFIYVPYPINRGKGYAIRKGFAEANAPVVLYTDLDFPYEMASLLKVAEGVEQGMDLAIGVKNAAYYEKVPPTRRFLSKMLRWSTGRLLGLPITDTQCGLKAFSPKGRQLMLQTSIDRYLFDLECIFLASKQPKLVLKAVPIQLRDGVIFSSFGSRVLLQEGWNFLRLWVRSWSRSGKRN